MNPNDINSRITSLENKIQYIDGKLNFLFDRFKITYPIGNAESVRLSTESKDTDNLKQQILDLEKVIALSQMPYGMTTDHIREKQIELTTLKKQLRRTQTPHSSDIVGRAATAQTGRVRSPQIPTPQRGGKLNIPLI